MEPNLEQDQVSRILLLVPTPGEMNGLPLEGLQAHLLRDIPARPMTPGGSVLAACCGFGSIAAAARTVELVRRFQPGAVLLAGIAGTYGIPKIEEAGCFRRVTMGDLGASGPQGLLLPSQLGIPQWLGESSEGPVFESLPLCPAEELTCWDELITVNVATGSDEEADARRERFPAAAAEDMEGFGVALACAMTNTPLTIIRGISNRVGDRHVSGWRIEESLAQVDRLVTTWCLRRLVR